MNKWDERMMNVARNVASWSKDPNRKVGALIVSPDKRQTSWGYNGPPADFDFPFENKIQKNEYTIHAELNAILNAAVDIQGWDMYITAPPCLHCALAIAQKRINRIVIPEPDPNSSWYDSHVKALHLLNIKRVDVFFYTGEEDA